MGWWPAVPGRSPPASSRPPGEEACMPSRRALLTAAAVAGFGYLGRSPVHAVEPPPAPGAPVWSAEYEAKKGLVSLAMFRKRLAPPQAGERPRPALGFVHGSSVPPRPSLDLPLPGAGRALVVNGVPPRG